MKRPISHILREERLFIILLFSAAFLLRLIYIYQSKANPFFDAPIVDAKTFLDQALGIAQGDWLAGREPFWQPPLYPYFLALLCRLFPDHYFIAIRLVQILLDTGSCVLIYLLAKKATTLTAARFASAMAAVYGLFIYFDGELLAVPVEIFLNLLLLYGITIALESQRRRNWLGVGILAGLASITRPNILLFIFFLLLWLIRPKQNPSLLQWGKNLLAKGLPIAISMSLVILPVTLRNYLLGGDIVFISSNGGVNFYIGNNAHYDSTVAIHPGLHWEKMVLEPVQAGFEEPSARSQYFFQKAFSYAISSPLDYGSLLLKKLWLFWNGPEIKRNQDIYYARRHSSLLSYLIWDYGCAFPFGLIGPLSLLGLALSWKKRVPAISLFRLYALSYMGSVLLFFVTARFRAPTIPILLIFAGLALDELAQRWRHRSYRSLGLLSAFFLCLCLLLNQSSSPAPEEDAQLYHDLGEVYLRKQAYAQSATHSLRALELEEAYPSAHHNLAVAYFHQKRFREAANHARRSLILQPLNPHAMVVLAQVQIAVGQWPQAENHLQRALKIDASLGSAHYQYGRLRLRQGRYREARPHLSAAARWKSDDFWVHYELAQVHQGLGQPTRALEFFRQAHLLDPQRPEALTAMGAMCLLTRDPDRANTYFARALDLDPENPEALINLGLVALNARRFPEAIQYLQRALKRAADPAPVYRALIQAYLESGQKEKAQELLSRWKDRSPAPKNGKNGTQ